MPVTVNGTAVHVPDGARAISLPARVIPAPSTISSQAQATLTIQSPLFDEPEPSPDDKEAWRRYVRRREERVAGRFASVPDLGGDGPRGVLRDRARGHGGVGGASPLRRSARRPVLAGRRAAPPTSGG